jgi:hypothetical protein
VAELCRPNRLFAFGNSRADHFGVRNPVENKTVQVRARFRNDLSSHPRDSLAEQFDRVIVIVEFKMRDVRHRPGCGLILVNHIKDSVSYQTAAAMNSPSTSFM